MRKILILVLIATLSVSCSNDDDTNDRNNSGLNGQWDLVNVTGGPLGFDQDFEKGVIVWEFNESNKKVTITNNNTFADVFDGFPSGTYSYSISSPAADAVELTVNDTDLGAINFAENAFMVNQLEPGGIKMSFSR